MQDAFLMLHLSRDDGSNGKQRTKPHICHVCHEVTDAIVTTTTPHPIFVASVTR